MNLKKLKIGDLKIAAYNPRKELTEKDKEYQKIKNSIIEFGYVTPIIVNSDMTVISGHQRLKVLKDLKYEDIDCIIVEFDKNKEKLLNIALNKISGEWDYQKLESIFNELEKRKINKTIDFKNIWNNQKINEALENINIDLSITGFDDKEINKFIKETEEIITENEEVNILDFSDEKFKCQCPKCGFMFDVNK